MGTYSGNHSRPILEGLFEILFRTLIRTPIPELMNSPLDIEKTFTASGVLNMFYDEPTEPNIKLATDASMVYF